MQLKCLTIRYNILNISTQTHIIKITMSDFEARKKKLAKMEEEIKALQPPPSKIRSTEMYIGKYRAYLNLTIVCCTLSVLLIAGAGVSLFASDSGKYFITTQDGHVEEIFPYKIL